MPRAVAVGLPEPALQISASPSLLAATPYSVRLQRCCDQAAPLGKVASVDSLGTAMITASA
jgi:hypothetical protein